MVAYHIFNDHPEVLSEGLNNLAFGVLKQVDPRFLADARNLEIFIDDMTNVVKHSSVKLFADDSKLCKEVKCLMPCRPTLASRRSHLCAEMG